MASAPLLRDIDEQFLQCCLCMERLKDPKILRCLHRYCLGCLKTTVKTKDNKIECPTCRETHTLPEGGIDGLKTDFNTKNIIEFIQLQESIKHDPLKDCGGCSQKLKVSAYCFRCNEFLCQECHGYHKAAKILKDHHDHIFSQSEAEAGNLTVAKISFLKEAPRCPTHPQNLSELCCTRCENIPICFACTYGAHKGHEIQEVTSLAEREREKLNMKIADLMQYKDRIFEVQGKIKNTKELLGQTTDEEKRELQEQRGVEEESIKRSIAENDQKLKKRQQELEETLRRKAIRRNQELEEQIKALREVYEKVCEEDRREADEEFKKLQRENDREKVKLQEGLDTMNKTTLHEEKTKEITELSDHFDHIVKKFENVTTTASTIFAARHNWTDIQCIPDICMAIDPLIEEVNREMPGLEALSDLAVKYAPSVDRKERVDISEEAKSVVDIKGIKKGWQINGITSSKDGTIIITGGATGNKAHLAVLNKNGEQLRQLIFESTYPWPRHCSDILSQSKVTFIHWSRSIGIYDFVNDSQRKINVLEVVPQTLPQSVQCVVVDHVNNNIFVGCSREYVHVFDKDLMYVKTLRLPEKPRWLADITIHNGILLLCDRDGERAYAVTISEPQCKVLYVFPSPDNNRANWAPHHNVCTDKNGFIYILWGASISGNNRSMVVQYSKDGSEILLTRLLNENYYAECITTVDTEQGELLVMATFKTGKLITYELIK